MRWLLVLIFCVSGFSARAADGRVIKVLPQYLDLKGRSALSPSLFDRDAYQKVLLLHPDRRSGMRYAIQWKAKTPETEPLKLRVELRGIVQGTQPRQTVIEQTVAQHGSFSQWASLTLTGDDYRKFGEVTAWRATLWDGDQLLGEQKSFLW